MERAAERESAAEKRYQDLQQKQRELIRRANTRAGRKEMTQKQRDNRVMKEWQQKTLRQLQWLSKNRRRAPAEWKAVWDETLGDIDIFAVSAARETAYSKKYGASWKDLAQIYTEAKEKDPNFLSSKEMETIVDRVYKIKLEDMDLDDLQTLYRMAAGLRTEFYNRNNVINDEKNRMFAEMYRDSKKEINDAPGGYVKGKFQHGADGFVNMQQLTPINVMQRMVGWNPNSAFFSMAKQLERGERDVRAHYVRANQLLETFLKENADWVSKADGQGKNATWYPVEVQELLELGMGDKPVFGDTIKVWMTPSQKVHLYLESRNEDSLRHMVGGRTFADKELYSQGKRREALEQGRTIRLAPESVMKIVADMTDTELELARVLDSYYNGYAKERINAVSNVLYGYDKAIGRNYAPIFANSNYVKQEVGVFNVTAEGVGNLKERQYSKNPSYNIGAFDAFERNVEQTARFVGMAIPARNLNTLLNWREKNNSMGDVITHKWGGEGKKYIEDILEDLQGGKQKEQSWFGKLADKALNNYISATFGFNPSIVLKQLGSIPLASAYLGVENTPNPAQLRRVDWGFVGKYTAELAHRTMGYTTPETKQLKDNPNWTQRNKAIRFLFGGGAITAMDGAAASVLWPWAENKVRRERPELEMGTQEEIDAGQSSFYKAVAEEFNDALNRSQSVSDQMHQSKLRKDRNPFARMFTMFRSDAAQTYNTLRQKIGEAQYYKRSGDKAAHRKVQRAAGAAVLAALVGYALVGGVDLLANLWKQMGKRYKDEEGNLTAESVFKEMAAGFAGNIFGVVAGGDTLADWIGTAITGERWYGLETPGATQINDLLMGLRDATDGARTAIVDAWNVLENGGDLGEYLEDNGADLAGGIKDAAVEAGTYIPGLPVKNVEAYLLGIVKWVRPEWATAYEDAFAEADKAGLAGLEGEALEARVAGILDNRLNGAKGEPAAALAGLYEAGFKKAIPSDTPSSISVDGESVELSAFQRQTYDLVWRGTVGASLDDLTASREFENASDENKEKMIDRLYRYAGEKAKLELFDGYEADGWVAKADEAVRSGMSAGDWATLYTEISLIDGDTTLKGAQKSNKKREVISHSGLPDAQKIMLYSHTISEERIDDIKAFQTAKLPFDVYLAAQNEYATLNEREDLTATQKATELSRWANQRGYTGEQAAAIRDTFTFFSMAPAEAKRYNELTDSGVDEEDAYELTNALNELEPLEGNKSVTNLQRYRETVDISTNPDVQLSLLMSVMGETEIQKVKLAYEYGVTPRDYVRAKELIEEDNKRKKAEDEDYGGVKNKDVEEVLEGMDDLERNQQAALYQVITRAKRNPFGARIRREIEKALEGE
jgi:hypothetical protein